MKRLVFVLQVLVVCLMANIALAMPQVVDEAQLLSQDQEQQLRQQLEGLEQRQGLRAAVVTLPTLGQKSLGSYADYLVNEGMEQGPKGTLVLVQVVDKRKWYISTDPSLSNTLGSAEAVDKFSKTLVPYLHRGDYLGAYLGFAAQAEALMDYYQEEPVLEKGWKLNEPALIFALFGAFIFTRGLRKKLVRAMEGVQPATAADDYLKQGSFELLEGSDDYMYSNTVRTQRRRGNNHDGDGNGGGSNGGGGGSY